MKKECHSPQPLPKTGYVRQRQLIPHYLPFCEATLWRKVRKGLFPKPVKLGPKISAWKAEDVHEWLAAVERGEMA